MLSLHFCMSPGEHGRTWMETGTDRTGERPDRDGPGGETGTCVLSTKRNVRHSTKTKSLAETAVCAHVLPGNQWPLMRSQEAAYLETAHPTHDGDSEPTTGRPFATSVCAQSKDPTRPTSLPGPPPSLPGLPPFQPEGINRTHHPSRVRWVGSLASCGRPFR